MSDAVTLPAARTPATEDPYATETFQYAGHEYTFSVYKGFASQVTFTPPGADTIIVYTQSGVFDCHDTDGPLPTSFMTINGGPLDFNIELEIKDGPLLPPNYRGPIESITIGLKKAGTTAAADHRRVKACKGGHQISRIHVKERVKLGEGGVFAFQNDDGGVVVVTNKAATCPPDCKA